MTRIKYILCILIFFMSFVKGEEKSIQVDTQDGKINITINNSPINTNTNTNTNTNNRSFAGNSVINQTYSFFGISIGSGMLQMTETYQTQTVPNTFEEMLYEYETENDTLSLMVGRSFGFGRIMAEASFYIAAYGSGTILKEHEVIMGAIGYDHYIFGGERFKPFLGGGATYIDWILIDSKNSSKEIYNAQGYGFLLRGGAIYNISNSYAIEIGYKYQIPDVNLFDELTKAAFTPETSDNFYASLIFKF